MKKIIILIMMLIPLVNLTAQEWLEKAAKEAQKFINKEIEKRQMEITGEGAPLVTNLDEAKKSLLGEVWMYGDEETKLAYILRFNENGNFEKTVGGQETAATVTNGKWEVKCDSLNNKFYVELDKAEKYIFQNSRQLLLAERLFRKTPSYIMK